MPVKTLIAGRVAGRRNRSGTLFGGRVASSGSSFPMRGHPVLSGPGGLFHQPTRGALLHCPEEVVAGALASPAGLGADAAVLVVLGVALALLGARPAGLTA